MLPDRLSAPGGLPPGALSSLLESRGLSSPALGQLLGAREAAAAVASSGRAANTQPTSAGSMDGGLFDLSSVPASQLGNPTPITPGLLAAAGNPRPPVSAPAPGQVSQLGPGGGFNLSSLPPPSIYQSGVPPRQLPPNAAAVYAPQLARLQSGQTQLQGFPQALPPGGLQLPATNTRAPQPIPNYSAFAQNMQLPRFSQPQAPRVGFGAPSRLPGFAIR